jgi:hypothetical protein
MYQKSLCGLKQHRILKKLEYQSSGKIFLDAFFYNGEEYFEADFIDLETEMDRNEPSTSGRKDATKEPRLGASKGSEWGSRIVTLKKMIPMENEINKRKHNDTKYSITNVKNEDCIGIT